MTATTMVPWKAVKTITENSFSSLALTVTVFAFMYVVRSKPPVPVDALIQSVS